MSLANLDFSSLITNVGNLFKFVGVALGLIGIIELFLYIHFKFGKDLKKSLYFILGLPLLAGLVYFLYKIINSNGKDALSLIYPTLLKVILITLPIEIIIYFLIRNIFNKYMLPVLLIAPGMLGMCLLIFLPFIFEIYLSFVNLNLYTMGKWIETGRLSFVGLNNFINVFRSPIMYRTETWWLILRNIIWTFENVFFQILFGTILALLLNRKLWAKPLFRAILIIPWTLPQVIAILAWKAEFAPKYGAINIILTKIADLIPFLHNIGIDSIPWRSHPFWTIAMVSIVNIWLGIPFIMVVILGGLQSISPDYYDSAALDGANSFQSFRFITLPLLKPILIPVIFLGSIWTFNAINVVFLMTGAAGGGGSSVEYADLVVSALYKAAFTFNRYSLSAALGVIIVIILLIFTIFGIKIVKGTESNINE